MFYLTMHSTHFIYGYMASDIWLRTILIVRKETHCRHIGYSYRLTARVLLYAPSHTQDNTYHGICYTSRGALAGTRNSSGSNVSSGSNGSSSGSSVSSGGSNVSSSGNCSSNVSSVSSSGSNVSSSSRSISGIVMGEEAYSQ